MCFLNSDRQLSVCMIAEEIDTDKMTVHSIIAENLEMRKICLNSSQRSWLMTKKQRRFFSCEDVLQHVEKDPRFLDNFSTPLQS